MISWIIRLCALCSMSALMQIMIGKESAKEALKMICGLLMLHLTLESGQALLFELTSSENLMQMLDVLLK